MRASWLSSLRRRMRRAFAKTAPAARPASKTIAQDRASQMPSAIRKHQEDGRLDEALGETFPASDPISPFIPSTPDKPPQKS